ncbi:DUF952 domain-containing protein [Flexibacterium corallicola]|uniref:DUF952 domain-containing protein n=1 Tax=Flexibacterium corallicola TaxID=3037259 RepID=UPI00286F859D|nr:DUF952 domain-containing protein [Pseudovibrio sp. M1P-2-3]
MSIIYKIANTELWSQAENDGKFVGAPIDLEDGYIHFSTKETVRETAAKYFSGAKDLLLIAVDTDRLNQEKLLWEPARNGALFPHLYEPLSLEHVLWVQKMPLGANGQHIFPEL